MKKKIISLILICISAATFIGCGSNNSATTNNSNTQQQENKFDEEKAKTDSKAQLEKFLNSHDNTTLIGQFTDMDKIKTFVKDNLFIYMTKDYQNDVTNQLSKSAYSHENGVFFLGGSDKIYFYNTFKMYTPTVDKEKQTVKYELEASGKGSPTTIYVHIEMKQEDGVWKINKESSL